MLILQVGNETQAVVEFAPYQKVPSEKTKVDNRIGTIGEGKLENLRVLRCVVYVNATQMKIISHSSSRWRVATKSRLMRKHSNT